MATLLVNQLSKSGFDLSAGLVACAAGGDQFPNSGRSIIAIRNAHATLARTLTIVTQKTVEGFAVPDRTVTLSALKYYIIDSLSIDVYNDATANCQLTYSDAAADLTIAILEPHVA